MISRVPVLRLAGLRLGAGLEQWVPVGVPLFVLLAGVVGRVGRSETRLQH